MTPIEQIAANEAAHASYKWLNDLLALWEAVDEASQTRGSLRQLRDDVGTAEMRDLCVTLHPYLQQVYEAYVAEFGDFEGGFDWLFIPLFIDQIDWAGVSYDAVPGRYHQTFTDLPSPLTTATRIHEGYIQ